MNDLDKELRLAVGRHDKNLVQELIERGADVNSRNHEGTTVLHHALRCQNKDDMIDFLIEKGADVKAQDNGSRTSLDYLFVSIKYCPNPYKVMWKLIEAGCDMNLPNVRGKTSFELALLYNNSHRANTDEETEKLDLEKIIFIDKLIDHGADVTGLKDDGWVHPRQKVFFRKYDQDTYLNLLSRGAIFTSKECVNYRAEFIDQQFITRILSDEKKYTGIKALRKAINKSDISTEIKGNAIREIDKTLAELKNSAFNTLVTKIREGFDNEKVEDRYRQIARDMSSDYPKVSFLAEFAESKITSEEFAERHDLDFLGSAIKDVNAGSLNPIFEKPELTTRVSAYLDLLELKNLRDALKPTEEIVTEAPINVEISEEDVPINIEISEEDVPINVEISEEDVPINIEIHGEDTPKKCCNIS